MKGRICGPSRFSSYRAKRGGGGSLLLATHWRRIASAEYYGNAKSIVICPRIFPEVQNAQHFDAFLPLAGYDNRLVPLHVYFLRAMDLMYAHLKHGAALPPSQVVRTLPRGGAPGAAPPITPANVPPIPAAPAAGDLVIAGPGSVAVPD